jgi:hypothetical protein
VAGGVDPIQNQGPRCVPRLPKLACPGTRLSLNGLRVPLFEQRIGRSLNNAGRIAWLLIALLLSACRVTAVSINNAEYLKLWQRDWSRVAADEKPLLASPSSPGVCNEGGDVQACYAASQLIVNDFRVLSTDLGGSIVPSAYLKANSTLQSAVAAAVSALTVREQAIRQNDNQLWMQSNTEISKAESQFQIAYSQFPSYARPLPAPSF